MNAKTRRGKKFSQNSSSWSAIYGGCPLHVYHLCHRPLPFPVCIWLATPTLLCLGKRGRLFFSSNVYPPVTTNLGSILLHLPTMACVILDPAVMRQQQYFEQVAEKPTYPRADSSLPSPLEGGNPMGEISENEGLHDQDKMVCLLLSLHSSAQCHILVFLSI